MWTRVWTDVWRKSLCLIPPAAHLDPFRPFSAYLSPILRLSTAYHLPILRLSSAYPPQVRDLVAYAIGAAPDLPWPRPPYNPTVKQARRRLAD